MNKSRGCAHGPYAEDPRNIAAATPARLAVERERYQQCKEAIKQQMRALEQENMLFALENPKGSYFWELTTVKSTIARMRSKGWTLHEVDQCAYGRMAKKPTIILTNIPWTPRGITGNGRCHISKCAGTMNNDPRAPGAREHNQQTVADATTRRTRMGTTDKGKKGEYSVEAAKNRVETMLVQEILTAARAEWTRTRKHKRKRTPE